MLYTGFNHKMEVFSLLQKIAIFLPTLLTAVVPGLYKIYTEDAGAYSEGEEFRKNNMHFSVSTNPLLDIFLYLSHMRSTSLTEPKDPEPYLYNTDVFPSIWSIILPYEYEDDEWEETDDGQSTLAKAVCKDPGPFGFYFPEKQPMSCQLVRGVEDFSKEYFWELLLPLTALVSAFCVYTLVRQEKFKTKWDNTLEYMRVNLSFYPPVQSALSSKIQELIVDSDSEDEIGDGDHCDQLQKIPCQCEVCSVHLAVQLQLKQRLEELESTFF